MAAVAGGRITAGVGANLIGQHAADRNQDATVYVGGLDPQVPWTACTATAPRHTQRSLLAVISAEFTRTRSDMIMYVQMSEELVWELFVQAGPVGKSS